MTIRDEIGKHVRDKNLFVVRPVLESEPLARAMFVSRDIQELLEGPWLDASHARRSGRLRADLLAFVEGDNIALALTPYRHTTAFMGRLSRPEDEVWDIRSRDPQPGLRLFGRFAEVDTFIAFNWKPRSVEWGGRRALGGRNNLDWQIEILECKQQWNNLFPDQEPFHGSSVNDYVSRNVLSI